LVTVLAVGATGIFSFRPLAQAWERWERQRWHRKALAAYNVVAHDDGPPAFDFSEEEEEAENEPDDPTIRRLYNLAYWGVPDGPSSQQLFRAAEQEKQRWSLPRQGAFAVGGQSWVSLGPTDARIVRNAGNPYPAIDSGRLVTVRVDPRDRNVVYIATAWGGVWKTYNFTSPMPAWTPLTDTLGVQDVGAFEMDPVNPDLLYLGIGDALDFANAGGAVYASADGGGTWTPLTTSLAGTYPASAGGRRQAASSIRDLTVDRNDPRKIFIATDVGLFRSVDAGQTFNLVPLPSDAVGAVTAEAEVWTLQYLGVVAGVSHWVVSGVHNLCGFRERESSQMRPAATPGVDCTRGNPGDIWRSSDAGATWVSLRRTGKLPTLTGEFGRIALGAGAPANPDATVVYAQVAGADNDNPQDQLGVFKSVDGGRSFTLLPGTTPNGTVTNPTVNTDCRSVNATKDQGWYNLAVGVDPTDSNHVLLGGQNCGIRSIDGGTTWSNVSHWLPVGTAGVVRGGARLPYVHADWHTISFSTAGRQLLTFAGTDGGLYSSTNVFTATTGEATVWNYVNNRGLASHQFYGLASGDPTEGDEQVIFGGLQDNGTRFRDLDPMMGSPTTFNQILGGDGVDTAIVRGPTGVGTVYWASVPGTRWYCMATTPVRCTQSPANWVRMALPMATSADPEPFMMHYAVIDGDPTGAMLTATTYNLFKLSYRGTTLSTTKLTPTPFNPPQDGMMPGNAAIRTFSVSPFTYKDSQDASFRLYGVVLSQGYFAVGTDKAGTVTWSMTTARLGAGATKDKQLGNGTAIAFPASAAHFKPGAADGSVFIVGSTAPRMFDGLTPVPDASGRIFLTTDGGTTFQPFHGDGTSDLPNVPIQTILFDPTDTDDRTIFVGNDLGVYRSSDAGKSWIRFGVGLPMVRVTEMHIAKNAGLLRVSTYGRGLWEIFPHRAAAPGVRGDGDWDRNQQIDFLDLGAAASRLGTTPETADQPYFDWHLDLVGTTNSIGDEDLTALLAKFGSHP
jgi:hypothetical protein